MTRYLLSLIIALFLSQAVAPMAVADTSHATVPDKNRKQVLFCGDKAGWPPYTYEDGNTLKGYDLDVLAEIFNSSGLNYDVIMLPWRRCLEMVKQGLIDVALSASGTQERAIIYRMTQPYYYVTPSYIHLKSRFPQGVRTPPTEVTRQYKVCGLRGYSYHSFGLPPEDVETTSRTFAQLFNKTAAGRCDILLGRYEILVGFSLTGQPLITDKWQHSPVPGIEVDDFRMLVSRAIDDSVELHQMLNRRIAEMRDSDELDRLLQPYLE